MEKTVIGVMKRDTFGLKQFTSKIKSQVKGLPRGLGFLIAYQDIVLKEMLLRGKKSVRHVCM